MKKKLIRIISCVLAVITLFSASCFSMAYATSDCPTIYIAGIATKNIYRFNEDGSQTGIFPPATEKMVSAVKNIPDSAVEAFKRGDDARGIVGNVLINAFNDIFEELCCDETGKPYPNTGIIGDNTIPSYSSSHDVYDFVYDWRISMFDIAEQLHTYIANLKAQTGKDKVNIIAFSMGGAVFTTYLSMYGNSEINSVVMNSTAVFGATVCGEPMCGDVDLKAENLAQYIDCFAPDFSYKELVISLAKLLKKTYQLDIAVEAIEDLLMEYKSEIYSEVLLPTFATLPGVWALCPDEQYEDAKKFLFEGKEEKYAELIKTNDKYHYGVQANAKTFLDSLIANGINLNVISKYNAPITPVCESYDVHTDGVIDTKYTSFGATCSKINKTLPEDYVQAKYPETNYISPDRIIDASTCLYPEYTFFVRDMPHSVTGDDFYVMAHYLLDSPTQVTVRTNPKYPQFMVFDRDTEVISPLTSTEAPNYNAKNILLVFFDFIRVLWKTVISLFK